MNKMKMKKQEKMTKKGRGKEKKMKWKINPKLKRKKKDYGKRNYYINDNFGNRGFSAKITGKKKVFLM